MKRRKSIYTNIAVLLLLLLVSACEDFKFGNDFLDKPFTTDNNIDTVFSRKVYAEQALAEIYRSLPDFQPTGGRMSWAVLECMTDLGDAVKPGGIRAFHAGDVDASSTGSMPYRLDVPPSGDGPTMGMAPMAGIRKAYIYLENVSRVPDMTDKEKSIRKAEAKAIIAFHYIQMLRYYGGIPWLDRTYLPDEELKFTRMTIEETVQKTQTLLEEAARELPWKVSAADEGRMTAAAVLGLKSRMLQFVASPLFNNTQPYMPGEAADKHYVWYGNYEQSRWQDALDAGLEFLSANKENADHYKLVNTGKPREDFVSAYFDRYNGEVLLASHRWVTYNMWGNAFAEIIYGMAGATSNYADMFERTKDGSRMDWTNPEHRAHPFFDATGAPTRDIRLYETLYVNGDKFRGRPLEIYKGGREQCDGYSDNLARGTYNGYGMRKYQRDRDTEVSGKFYSCPLLRLPEIYLNIAEAMNELGLATTKDKFGRDAYDYINLVRNRVKMPDLTSAKAAPGIDLREAILHERAVEMGFEEVRYFDLTRWKRADLFQTSIERLIVTKNEDGSFHYTKDTKLANPRGWIQRWTDRYFLIPFPLDEINKKYGLTQNPGWE